MTFVRQNARGSVFARFSEAGAAKDFQHGVSERAFVAQLTEFGLKEKEARVYFYLLRNGPKSVTDLSKFANTYREDVYRRLDVLIQEGLVEQSIEKPSKYTAVPLRAALDVILQKHTYARRQMEMVRSELLQNAHVAELANGEVDAAPSWRVVKGVHEVLATGSRMTAGSESSIRLTARPDILPKLARYGIIEEWKEAALRGVRIRAITDAIPTNVAALKELAKAAEVRYLENYAGISFWVTDNKETVTVLATTNDRASLAHSAFWTDSPQYAGYLTSFFDLIWERSAAPDGRANAVSSRVKSKKKPTAGND
jgi:sugar-specific transcriptional regulator TrmB